ncbi:hypothetical protein ACQKML_00425 [Peribacillus frigoritolerans]
MGKAWHGSPRRRKERRGPTDRGKRVPGVEINVSILDPQKIMSANNDYLVCKQNGSI